MLNLSRLTFSWMSLTQFYNDCLINSHYIVENDMLYPSAKIIILFFDNQTIGLVMVE